MRVSWAMTAGEPITLETLRSDPLLKMLATTVTVRNRAGSRCSAPVGSGWALGGGVAGLGWLTGDCEAPGLCDVAGLCCATGLPEPDGPQADSSPAVAAMAKAASAMKGRRARWEYRMAISWGEGRSGDQHRCRTG